MGGTAPWRRVEISGSAQNSGGPSAGIAGLRPGGIVGRPGKGLGAGGGGQSPRCGQRSSLPREYPSGSPPQLCKGGRGKLASDQSLYVPHDSDSQRTQPSAVGRVPWGRGGLFPALPVSQLLGPATGHIWAPLPAHRDWSLLGVTSRCQETPRPRQKLMVGWGGRTLMASRSSGGTIASVRRGDQGGLPRGGITGVEP